MYCSQKLGEDFAKFCGLLRIYELYDQIYQMKTTKDLVRIASEMIAEKITYENLNDIIELTHTVHSPVLKEACFNFIKINIQDVFSIDKGILERLSTVF